MFPIRKKSIFHLIETLKFLVSPEISWIEVQKNILEAILPVTMTIKWGPYGGKIKHFLHFIWYHLYHRLFKCQNGDFYWLKWPNLKDDSKPPMSKHMYRRLNLGPYLVTTKKPSSLRWSSRNKPGPKVFDYSRQLQYFWSASHRDLKKLTCPSTHRQNKKVEGVQSGCSICQQRKNWRPKQTAAGMCATRGK